MKEPDMIAINEKQASALEALGIDVDVTYAVPLALAETIKTILERPRKKKRSSPRGIARAMTRTNVGTEKFGTGTYTRAAADKLMVLQVGTQYTRDDVKKAMGKLSAEKPWLINALIREGFLRERKETA